MLLAGDEAFFSSLPQAQQEKLRAMVVALPPQQRYGPYSTPMYYLMRKGYSYNGAWDRCICCPNGAA
jgi:hypothetical protein